MRRLPGTPGPGRCCGARTPRSLMRGTSCPAQDHRTKLSAQRLPDGRRGHGHLGSQRFPSESGTPSAAEGPRHRGRASFGPMPSAPARVPSRPFTQIKTRTHTSLLRNSVLSPSAQDQRAELRGLGLTRPLREVHALRKGPLPRPLRSGLLLAG